MPLPVTDEALTLQPERSPRLACMLGVAHGLALALVWLALPIWWWSGLLSIPVAASFVLGLRRHALRTGPQAVVEIVLRRDGSGRFTLRNGRIVEGRLHGDSFVAPALAIIRLVPEGRHGSLSAVVASDALPAEAFRRQRVWLRWARSEP